MIPPQPKISYTSSYILKQNMTSAIAASQSNISMNLEQGSILNLNGSLNLNIQNDFEAAQNSTINVNGTVIIYANSFRLAQNAKIIITPGSSLQIYANDKIDIEQNANLNILGKSNQLIIASQNSIVFEQNSNSNLMAYSNGTITVQNNAKINGALTAQKLNISKKADIIYDKDAANFLSYAELCKINSGGDINPLGFDAWEPILSSVNAKLYSKYAGQDFSLIIGALDANKVLTLSQSQIEVLIVDDNGQIFAQQSITFNGASQVSVNFTLDDVAKNLRIKFIDSDKSGVCGNGCLSSDFFSVRPAYFEAKNLNINQVAGLAFNISLYAKNANSQPTIKYNGVLLSALNTANKSDCITFNALEGKNKNFTNGIFDNKIRFTDIGQYKLLDSSWLGNDECVSSSSSNIVDINGKIGCDTALASELNVKLFDFKFSNLSFNQQNRGYTYMLKNSVNDLHNMNISFEGKMIARACDINGTSCIVAKNYSSKCYANDSILTLTLPTKTGVVLRKEDNLTSQVPKNLGFMSGELNINNIIFNYQASNQTPVDPIKMDYSNTIFSITDSFYNVYSVSDAASFDENNSNAYLLYARINVPDQTCYSLSCNNFIMLEEVYALSADVLPLISYQSPNGANWHVLSSNDLSNVALNLSAGFQFSMPIATLGTQRSFGVSSTNAPSICIISSSDTTSSWLKYKTNIIGRLYFYQSSSDAWNGSGEKSNGAILQNGIPGYIREQKINR